MGVEALDAGARRRRRQDGRGPRWRRQRRRARPHTAHARSSSSGGTAAVASRMPPGPQPAGRASRLADEPVAGRHRRAVAQQRSVADNERAAHVAHHHLQLALRDPSERPGPAMSGPASLMRRVSAAPTAEDEHEDDRPDQDGQHSLEHRHPGRFEQVDRLGRADSTLRASVAPFGDTAAAARAVPGAGRRRRSPEVRESPEARESPVVALAGAGAPSSPPSTPRAPSSRGSRRTA